MRVVGNYISGVAADHLADVDDSLVFRLFLRCARQIADPFGEARYCTRDLCVLCIDTSEIFGAYVKRIDAFVRRCAVCGFAVYVYVDFG